MYGEIRVLNKRCMGIIKRDDLSGAAARTGSFK